MHARLGCPGFTHGIHAKVMADAVLPSAPFVLGFAGVFPEPLVELLQGHGIIRLAHQSLVDELGVGFIGLVVMPSTAHCHRLVSPRAGKDRFQEFRILAVNVFNLG